MRDEHRDNASMITVSSAVMAGILGLLIATPAALADCTASNALLPLCLDGTTIAQDYKSAIVEQVGNPGQIEIEVEDTVLDWRVVEIGPQYVKLEKDGNTIKLSLEADKFAANGIKKGPMKFPHTWEARGEREPPP